MQPCNIPLHRTVGAPLDQPLPMSAQRGEGVISMAIAVLIIAALGVLMWVGFQTLWQTTEADISDQVGQIGG
ncbi:MAG: hypothetical protein ACR2QE_01235 [Acidimicrobiales bacterium]